MSLTLAEIEQGFEMGTFSTCGGAYDHGMSAQMPVSCPHCEEAVLATVVGEIEYYDPEEGPPARYSLVQCSRKGHAILVQQEDYGPGAGFDEDRPYRLYPPQHRIIDPAVPNPLREEHDQALRCFEAKIYTAAVVMVGRTLEGVCAEHGVNERNLQRSLEVMHQRGLIDARLLEWAQALRVLRNEGAHYTGTQVNRADAEDALAFAQAVLDYVYVLTARFEKFKARRQSQP
jgi:hypothetical protein